MKYCMLTDLNILTESIDTQIQKLLTTDRHLLTLTSEYHDDSKSEINHKYLHTIKSSEELETYKLYKEKMTNSNIFVGRKSMNFDIHKLPDSLEQEIFNQLPDKIKNMDNPPYIRLQTMYNGDFVFPHSDYDRTAALLTIVSDNREKTCWWKQTEYHELPGSTMPDIDKIERAASVYAGKGETWLFDVHEIHSVEREIGHHNDRRITINFRWSKTPMKEIIAALL
jgi:hypothetical protein